MVMIIIMMMMTITMAMTITMTIITTMLIMMMMMMMIVTEFTHFPDFGEKGTPNPQEGFSTPISENVPLGIPGIPVWAPS